MTFSNDLAAKLAALKAQQDASKPVLQPAPTTQASAIDNATSPEQPAPAVPAPATVATPAPATTPSTMQKKLEAAKAATPKLASGKATSPNPLLTQYFKRNQQIVANELAEKAKASIAASGADATKLAAALQAKMAASQATAQAKLADSAKRAEEQQARAPQVTAATAMQATLEAAKVQLPVAPVAEALGMKPEEDGRVDKHQITSELLNEEQRHAVALGSSGVSFALIGSAGTGKTTTQRVLLNELACNNQLRRLPDNWNHKYLLKGSLSIAVVSFTNRAVNNIRSALPTEFKQNAVTLHKLLEFAPVDEMVEVPQDDGSFVEVKRRTFKPSRHKENKLVGLTHIVVEESTTINMELWNQLIDALPDGGADVTFIFLGDLKQLPPVFGKSVLSEKLPGYLKAGTAIELTRVYRQATDSPIKRLAIDINEGKPISDKELRENYAEQGKLEFINLSGITASGNKLKRRPAEEMVFPIVNMYKKLLDSGEFVPFRDTILCPFRVNRNNGINCEHINLLLANHHGKKRGAEVFEVVAGFTKRYLAIGDPVILDKQEYYIQAIRPNPAYKGMPARPSSVHLDRFGHYEGEEADELDLNAYSEVEAFLKIEVSALKPDSGDEDEVKRSASHILTLRTVDSDPDLDGVEVEVQQVGSINNMDFGYATTVHKAIGSEWDRVYLCLHHSMASMISRELLYTAVTRAKSFLQVIYDGQNHYDYKPNSSLINKAILNPEIKGVTLAEKISWLEKQESKKTESTKDLLSAFTKKTK